MSDYRAEARRAARRHGIDPGVFERQIGAESAFNPDAASPAGAVGIAQIMPQTAKGWGVNPRDPIASLDAAAKNMARYVRQYGSYRDALVAYNAGPGRVGKPLYAETRNYISRILGGKEPASGPSARLVENIASRGPQRASASTSAGPQINPVRQALLAQVMARSLGHNNPLVQQLNAQTPAPADASIADAQQGTVSSSVVRTAPRDRPNLIGQFKIAPGADRAGTPTSQLAKDFFSTVAGHARKTITVTTGTNHKRLTTNGNVSDHWGGNAGDFAVPVDSRDGDMLAAHALVAAGVPWAQALSMAQKGGLFNITPKKGKFKGRRIQVIWKTTQGGNHHDHVHIGIQ